MGIRTLAVASLLFCVVHRTQSTTLSMSLQQINAVLAENQDATFKCRASGTGPDPRIEWLIKFPDAARTLYENVTSSATTTNATTPSDGFIEQQLTIYLDTSRTNKRLYCSAWDGTDTYPAAEVLADLVPTITLGSSCGTCGLALSICQSGVCVCSAGYYDNDGPNVFGGTCLAQIALGNSCPGSVSGECAAANSQCTNSICACSVGYTQSGASCISASAGIGDPCSATVTCATPLSSCVSGLCQCPSGYYDSNDNNPGGSCLLQRTLGQSCTVGISNVCSATNSGCLSTTSTCVCNSGYTQTASNTCSLQTANLGQSCATVSCSVANSECVNTVCNCRSGYFAVGATECRLQSTLGQSCTVGISNTCSATNSGCISTTSTCVCNSGYTQTAFNTCSLQTANLGQSCATVSCSVANSECVNTVCNCRSGYFAVGATECRLQSTLGQSCTVGISNTCSATNSGCLSTTSTCVCNSGYTQTASNTCSLQTANLGQSCATVSCSVANSECVNTVCNCRSGYFAVGATECRLQSTLGQSCTVGISNACSATNSGCISTTSTCVCNSGYTQTASNTCSLQTGDSQSNAGANSCSSSNNYCNSTTSLCDCISGYVYSSNNCGRPTLGDSCSSAVRCLDTSTGSNTAAPQCSNSNNVCVCPSSYFGYNNICYRKASLGASCNTAASGSCSDANAVCSSGTCTCTTSYTNVGGVCTSSGTTNSQCPQSTQSAVTMTGATNAPNIYVEATCYSIVLYDSETLPCMDTKPGGGALQAGAWVKRDSNGDFQQVTTSTGTYINGDFTNPNLTISNAQASYAGVYRCRLCYGTGFTQCTDSADIEVKIDGAEITAASVDVAASTVTKDAAVTLSCTTTPAGVATTFQWQRNNVVLGSTESTYRISSVSRQDAGSYICSASNQYNANSPVTSSAQVLNVQYTPEYSIDGGGDTIPIPADLSSSPEDLNCDVLANPAVTVYRFYDESGIQLYSGTSNLFTITSSQGYQRYYCTATNIIGTSSPLYFQVQQSQGPNIGAATEDDGGISTGAIAAIVLGLIFLLLLIIIIIICCCNYGWCRKKEKVEPATVITQPPVKPYIPRVLVSEHGSTISRKDVGIMMNGTHSIAVSTDFEEPITPRYYLKPATSSGPIISMFEDNYDQPRAHQLPALDTHYLYRDDEPKKKRKRRKKRRHHEEEPPQAEPEARYAEVQPPEDDDLVVIPGGGNRHTYYE